MISAHVTETAHTANTSLTRQQKEAPTEIISSGGRRHTRGGRGLARAPGPQLPSSSRRVNFPRARYEGAAQGKGDTFRLFLGVRVRVRVREGGRERVCVRVGL